MYLNIFNVLQDILPKLQSKKVIIFGTGEGANKVFSILSQLKINIDYFIDNDSKKWETFVFEKKIFSPETILNEPKEDILILIASNADEEISFQLEKMGFVKNINFYSTIFTKSKYDELKIPSDIVDSLDDDCKDLLYLSKPYTMTSVPRMFALYNAVKYVVENDIPGDFVECGVWRGGSCMLMALTLMKLGNTSKKIYLYDTFTGMTQPTEKDIDNFNVPVYDFWQKCQKEERNEWCYASLEDVQNNIYSTGYPKENIIFVKGMVEDTIPQTISSEISLLRLDTDWYESTHHELVHLFPKLTKNGVLIIDDYGYCKGARQAVDEYFQEENIKVLLNRIDYTGRLCIKNI